MTDNGTSQRQEALKERIRAISRILMEREASGVYGSPEIIASYCQENMRLRNEADALCKELEVLEKQSRLDQLWDVIRERENSCVYGSPEVIERYESETYNLRLEAQKLAKELEN